MEFVLFYSEEKRRIHFNFSRLEFDSFKTYESGSFQAGVVSPQQMGFNLLNAL